MSGKVFNEATQGSMMEIILNNIMNKNKNRDDMIKVLSKTHTPKEAAALFDKIQARLDDITKRHNDFMVKNPNFVFPSVMAGPTEDDKK